MIHYIVSKKINQIAGVILTIFVTIIPATTLYLINRFKLKKELLLKEENTICKNSRNLKVIIFHEKCQKWMLRSSLFKKIEMLFENSIQVLLLLFVILLKYSNTNTILGFENLFSGDEAELIAWSAVFSVASMAIGEVKWQATLKNNFMPLKGKLLLFVNALIGLTTRISAVVIFFAPSMGFFSLLSHWKLGSLNPSEEYKIYSMSFVDQEDQTKHPKKWVIMENYTDLTLWSLETYFVTFIILIPIHFTVIFIIKLCVSINFESKSSMSMKLFHILTQLTCPTIYHDWDEHISNVEDMNKNWMQVCKEMKILFALFTFEHIMLCIPLWILSYKISLRNNYLDDTFPQVIEEQRSTTLAYWLSVVFPTIYILIPFIQYGLFVIYHKHGHPWSRILNPDMNLSGKKDSLEQEELKTVEAHEMENLFTVEDDESFEEKEKK